MKLLDSVEVKAQIKVVLQDLDDVLHELKTVAAELRAIIQQMDDISARIDLEEELGKSSQLRTMSLPHPRGRPNGQKTARWGHYKHISDITGGWASRDRCEYPDILASRPQHFTALRETPILDSESLYPLDDHARHRPYNTLDTSQLRKREFSPNVATKSQTFRPSRGRRASPIGAESESKGSLSPHKILKESQNLDTWALTLRNGPTTAYCVNKRGITPVVSECPAAVHGPTAHRHVLHGNTCGHTCQGSTGGAHSGGGTDSDYSTRVSDDLDTLSRRTLGEDTFSFGHSTRSSLLASDENVLLTRQTGCFSCSESNTDSQEEVSSGSCLTTSRTWRCRTVSDARRRFFRKKVELRNGIGIKYNTIGHGPEKRDSERDSTGNGRTCSALMCSRTRVVSTGSQTTEDISDIVAEERVKNYMKDYINLKDEITKL
ncbi:uncharacterized protein LOC118410263 [Branchiostoma floridae]|uniref:Uncharacterized protein LOC118410263 n=1 Tax=Branchiostoma floridae TaxID=7739 RepID=C3ZPH9_BRAFL|nr:uncharacterized protein LOC118410263 [Branchiostoma floridae]|eukprot:XP_002589537.1 hypothetical protein BRAFLDRAFT_128190 [Branchiostoma floridae]